MGWLRVTADSMIATILRQAPADRRASIAAWRQLTDILAQRGNQLDTTDIRRAFHALAVLRADDAALLDVVAAAGLPTVLYDYPQRTGVPFSFDTLDQLASNPLILGIKEASGDLTRPGEITRRYAGAIDVVCGADAAIVEFLDSGTRCWIGGIANLLPVAHVAILDPSSRADAYNAIAPVLTFIEAGQYNAKVKAGMALRGLDVGKPRGPVTAIDDVTRNELHALLDAAGDWAPGLTTA